MPRSTLATVILGAAVLALLALQVATSQRISKLQEQLARLEERPGPGPAAAGGGSEAGRPGTAGTDLAAGQPAAGGGTGGDAPGRATAGSGAADAPETAPGRKPVARASDGPLTEQDIVALIDRKLAEHDKKNPLAAIMNFEDPLTVMDRELKLSPIQKTRIQQHFKERDDAIMDLWQSEEGRKDWRGTEAKAGELRKKCEESVKRELDLAQQEKYEELKKAGKISDFGAGVSIMIDRNETGDDASGNAK